MSELFNWQPVGHMQYLRGYTVDPGSLVQALDPYYSPTVAGRVTGFPLPPLASACPWGWSGIEWPPGRGIMQPVGCGGRDL